MPIPFTCPHCGAQTHVSEQFAGHSGPCGNCGRPITVPPAEGAAAYGPPARGSNKTWLIVLGAALPAILLVGIALIGVLLGLLLPAIQAARQAARQAQCANNLHQIGIAMMMYELDNGCFPPAYIADETGRPMHSWRVLLLPYIEENTLYDVYDFDEPWDGPHNAALADMMPSVYGCPSSPSTEASNTAYVMVVGPGMISDGPTATPTAKIVDAGGGTIMVVETAGPGINWLEPRDCDSRSGGLVMGQSIAGQIGSSHPGGVNVLFCDGSVQSLDKSTSPKELNAMATIAGGEQPPPQTAY